MYIYIIYILHFNNAFLYEKKNEIFFFFTKTSLNLHLLIYIYAEIYRYVCVQVCEKTYGGP